MDKWAYASMTWKEVNDAALARRVILIPVAAIEQHGPHLPIDTDNLIGTHYCDEAAKRRPDLLISTPCIEYGYNEHNMDFPGTISIKPETLLHYYFDVGESFARQGFDRLIYVNAHGSNAQIANLAARMIVTQTPAIAAAINSWELAKESMVRLRDSRSPGGMSHACEYETSVYLHVRPEGVKREEIVDEYPPARVAGWHWVDMLDSGPLQMTDIFSRNTRTGIEGAPSLATPEKGREFAETAIRNLVKLAEGFRDMPVHPRIDFRAKRVEVRDSRP
jgi:creatinine amidohydrolase